MAKERMFNFSQAKQSVLEWTSQGKGTMTGGVKIVESKTQDSTAVFSFTRMLRRSMLRIHSLAAVVVQRIECCLSSADYGKSAAVWRNTGFRWVEQCV